MKTNKNRKWDTQKLKGTKPAYTRNAIERMKRIGHAFSDWPYSLPRIGGNRTIVVDIREFEDGFESPPDEKEGILLDIHNDGDGLVFSGKLVEAFIEGLENIKAEKTGQ